MESALTISPPVARARSSARADLPLAVGPAISQTGDSAAEALFLAGRLAHRVQIHQPAAPGLIFAEPIA
jgi:hypothetical protein